jgi:hypothetical protein
MFAQGTRARTLTRISSAALAAGLVLISACAGPTRYSVAASGTRLGSDDAVAIAPGDAGRDLLGTTVEVSSVDRAVTNRLQFLPDGVVYIVPSNRAVRFPARWEIRDNWLCVDWRPRGAECWPYEQGFRVGEPVTLTSNRGQTVHVTLISTREAADRQLQSPDRQ